jgi:hypothetical protein
LTSWTLQLCEGAAVTASSGDAQASASASAEASTDASAAPAPAAGDDDKKASTRIGKGKVAEEAKGMLGLLFPGLKEEDLGECWLYMCALAVLS